MQPGSKTPEPRHDTQRLSKAEIARLLEELGADERPTLPAPPPAPEDDEAA